MEADTLSAADPLLTPERVLEALQAVAHPKGESVLAADRLLRLAVSASREAALSSRLELYPRGMAAERALKLGAGSLLGPRKLPPEMIQARIASRYPEAAPLPGRPKLDTLLEDEGLHLRWSPDERAYVSPDRQEGAVSSSSTFSRLSTTTHFATDAPGIDEARALEQRLANVAAQRRLLVLTVAPKYYGQAEDELLKRFDLERVSLDALVLREMQASAETFGVNWEVVLAADAAARESRDWRNLQRVVEHALPAIEEALVSLGRPGLLLYPGLLARYGRLDLVERLRQACTEGRAPGYVLLIPADAQSEMPVIDRVPLPMVYRSDWERVPGAWLHNAHRGRPRPVESTD